MMPMFELFVARKIYFDKSEGKKISKPAVRIAMWGLAIGLAVMIISVAVVIGFKQEVREKVIGLGAHIQISNFDSNTTYEMQPIAATDSIMEAIRGIDGVKHVQRFTTKPGIIKTGDDFTGIVLKGIGPEYDTSFLENSLTEGEMPAFSDTSSTNRILISEALAAKMQLKLGDKIPTYSIEEQIRVRRFTIAGIYSTHFSDFDNLFIIGDLYAANRLNGWQPAQVSGMEVEASDYAELESVREAISRETGNRPDPYGGVFYAQTVKELYPQIFAWLDLLDLNVWVILILMIGVAGFTMISGLLIIILERTNMIGILKSLGAGNRTVRKIFLCFAAFLVGKGMLWGNIIGFGICLVQHFFHLVPLDPATYYVSTVPLGGSIWVFLLLNACTFILSMLILIGPSCLISKIHPARSMRYE